MSKTPPNAAMQRTASKGVIFSLKNIYCRIAAKNGAVWNIAVTSLIGNWDRLTPAETNFDGRPLETGALVKNTHPLEGPYHDRTK